MGGGPGELRRHAAIGEARVAKPDAADQSRRRAGLSVQRENRSDSRLSAPVHSGRGVRRSLSVDQTITSACLRISASRWAMRHRLAYRKSGEVRDMNGISILRNTVAVAGLIFGLSGAPDFALA